jgi:uncharacterized protein YeaO (DUF488 family)
VLVDRIWPNGTLLFGTHDAERNNAVALGSTRAN